MKVLQINASARLEGSISRQLGDRLAAGLAQATSRESRDNLVRRDLNDLPLLDEALLAAVAVEPAQRSPEQRALAALPDELIDELESADAVVIGVPIYNFGVPAALKAWIDLVARARRTFRYSDTGPVGLLADKPVYLVVASGGTAVDSDIDFATPYLRHVLGFLGLHDIRVIDASRLMVRGDAQRAAAEQAIDRELASQRAGVSSRDRSAA